MNSTADKRPDYATLKNCAHVDNDEEKNTEETRRRDSVSVF